MKKLLIILAFIPLLTGCETLRNIGDSFSFNPMDEDGMIGFRSQYGMIGLSPKAFLEGIGEGAKKMVDSGE